MITEYSMTLFRPLEHVESILLVLLYKTENIVVVCGVSLLSFFKRSKLEIKSFFDHEINSVAT
jgi:hypothetical protein